MGATSRSVLAGAAVDAMPDHRGLSSDRVLASPAVDASSDGSGGVLTRLTICIFFGWSTERVHLHSGAKRAVLVVYCTLESYEKRAH